MAAGNLAEDIEYSNKQFQETQLWGINTRLQYTPRFDHYILGAEMKGTR